IIFYVIHDIKGLLKTRYKARIKPKAKIGNMMTERQLLRIFIFFAQGLGRVQLIRYKGTF
ncbi:MAG: hypothetical protein U0J90_06555, partial [Streptococcus salivarius]|nr:hypothetical protein [Streptococcus salivarius]